MTYENVKQYFKSIKTYTTEMKLTFRMSSIVLGVLVSFELWLWGKKLAKINFRVSTFKKLLDRGTYSKIVKVCTYILNVWYGKVGLMWRSMMWRMATSHTTTTATRPTHRRVRRWLHFARFQEITAPVKQKWLQH